MSKISKLYIFLIALSSIVYSSCRPDLYSDPYSTKLNITYTVTEDLLDGLTPTVNLNVNGERSQMALSRADFTTAEGNKLKFEKTISYVGETGKVEMTVSYTKKNDFQNRDSYSIGHDLQAVSTTTCGSSKGGGSAHGSASMGSSSGRSYSDALDEMVARGSDVLAFSQAQLVSSMSIAVQGK
ncbi:MAG: hypothetical protein IJ785_02415 [Bacteroidales bacterium]|nr:hypothetical protein [Bacteroidales bacterium]